jgi:hypothetical protein
MPSEFSIHDGTAWKFINDVHIYTGTGWSRVQDGWIYTASGWKQFYQYDTTGPSPVTSLNAIWNNGFGPACYVTWNQPTDTDLSYSLLQKSITGINGTYTTIGTFTQGPGVACSSLDSSVTLSPYTFHSSLNQASAIHYYRVIPYDNKGNAGTAVTVGSTPEGGTQVRGYLSSPYYYDASGSASWVSIDAVWVEGVRQGYNSRGRGFGHYFYSNDVAPIQLHISSASILLKRGSAFGYNTPIPVGVRGSFASSVFSADPVSLLQSPVVYTGGFSYNTVAWATVDPGAAYQVAYNGYNSIVLDAEQDSGVPYSSYFSDWATYDTPLLYGNTYAGTLRINHSG